MPHRSEHRDAGRPLSAAESDSLADSMRAFGTGSRLRLLWAMLGGEQTVEELVELTGLASSSASHQLRLLRHGRLVAVRRVGRHAYYRLHDHHVAELLQAIRHHHEHVEPPEAGVPPIEDPARLAS
ncbi:MAG TPA: metalloregulator ArsR/SmtB family transcription factor [Gaiellaceae bacterium]|nr:metalloregulator ArsR/SmtB family transcription factor [Gaiellaceae bacterium]